MFTWKLTSDGLEPDCDEVDPDGLDVDEDLAFERARERRHEDRSVA